jgi:hypothetical protein
MTGGHSLHRPAGRSAATMASPNGRSPKIGEACFTRSGKGHSVTPASRPRPIAQHRRTALGRRTPRPPHIHGRRPLRRRAGYGSRVLVAESENVVRGVRVVPCPEIQYAHWIVTSVTWMCPLSTVTYHCVQPRTTAYRTVVSDLACGVLSGE